MSSHPIPDNPEERWAAVDHYLNQMLHPTDPVLQAALDAGDEAGLPAISVSPTQGKLLQLLAQAQSARRILEISALGGYSTIHLARALPPGGRIVTLELNPTHAEVALANIARAGFAYTYDDEGMLTSAGGAQYIYDALQQRVEKSGGSNPEEVVYCNGQPLALLNPSSGAWTDLIWAGTHRLAEVPGSQTASPTCHLLNHEGSLAATTDASGNLTGTNLLTPYGQLMASTTTDPYVYTGLYQDTEYSGDAAWYRDLSTRQARWLRPDPDNGSYDLMNPQSFNRYMYVNGNPLGYVDPSGLAGAGVLTGVGGAPCKRFGINEAVSSVFSYDGLSLSPCNPVGSAIADAVVLSAAAIDAWQTGQSISDVLLGNPDANTDSWTVSPNGNGYGSTASGIAASVGAAITIACSIDSNSDMCGQSGCTSDLIGGNAGKVVNDTIAVGGAIACFAGPQACLGYTIYQIANDLFSVFWGLFGPPQFTGSLLPRPSDLGGLGTAPIGIPNQNLTVRELLRNQTNSPVPSPGVVHP